MTSTIAIYGATGAVGSAFLAQLLRSGSLAAGDAIRLVGRGTPDNHANLLAIRSDLLDAFHEAAIDVTVIGPREELAADLVVVAAGMGLKPGLGRRDLAAANKAFFEEAARHVTTCSPRAFVIVVSNPNELAVSVFARQLGRERVVGMGAEQDSLRFARAVAERLGVHRSAIQASVLGEHGSAAVPVWSSVRPTTPNDALHGAIAELAAGRDGDSMDESLAGAIDAARQAALSLCEAGRASDAYAYLSSQPPAVRAMTEPLVNWRHLDSTPQATANATLRVLEARLRADGRTVHGQVLLDGEFYGLRGVCGVPLLLETAGWRIAAHEPLTANEQDRLRETVEMIQRTINEA